MLTFLTKKCIWNKFCHVGIITSNRRRGGIKFYLTGLSKPIANELEEIDIILMTNKIEISCKIKYNLKKSVVRFL